MDEFLRLSKVPLSSSSSKRVRVVLGNPTCDLDSAVSALVQGFCEYLDIKLSGQTDIRIIPILNVPQREFRLKTEVAYYLKQNNIPPNLLTFRDQVDLKSLQDDPETLLEVILVDHHVLPAEDAFLIESVVKVIDHRPQDPGWSWPGRKVNLEPVGSCASLVARNLLNSHPHFLIPQVSNLLRGPILIDTCNLSKEVDRARPLDYEIIDVLEKTGQLHPDRTKVFKEIVAAKSDISGLSVDDLMIRDLKVTAGIPIVGMPVLVANFLAFQGALLALEKFAGSRKSSIVIIIGLELVGGIVMRDIAVFSLSSDRVKDKLIEALTSSTSPVLQLSLEKHITPPGAGFELRLYSQGNLKATRKQILPIVRQVAMAEASS